jgi:hypothetical protein
MRPYHALLTVQYDDGTHETVHLTSNAAIGWKLASDAYHHYCGAGYRTHLTRWRGPGGRSTKADDVSTMHWDDPPF